MDEEFKNLIDYARGGAPTECGLVSGEQRAAEGSLPYTRPVPRKQPTVPGTVIGFIPKKEPTLQDEILQMLEELAAAIKASTVLPSHLIMGWGEAVTDAGESATRFIWDTTGLTRFELIGHLHTYACKLVNGEGE